jgi:hypothetical protein
VCVCANTKMSSNRPERGFLQILQTGKKLYGTIGVHGNQEVKYFAAGVARVQGGGGVRDGVCVVGSAHATRDTASTLDNPQTT